MKYLLLIIITGLLLTVAQGAEDDARKYQKCMTLVESEPQAAVTFANDWIYGGTGGVPAGHCKALGLLKQGQAQAAARLLEKLVDDMLVGGDADEDEAWKNAKLRVQLYGQAALAWKEAGDLDKSYVAYSSALSGIGDQNHSTYHSNHHPENYRIHAATANRLLSYELYLERGTLQILRGQYKAAIEDFTLAIEKDGKQFEGFLQRAKAYRKRRSFLKARLDLRVAAKLAADHPAILLESGILYRQQGQKLKAGLEWQKIIDLHPDSEYAELARTNMDLLKPHL